MSVSAVFLKPVPDCRGLGTPSLARHGDQAAPASRAHGRRRGNRQIDMKRVGRRIDRTDSVMGDGTTSPNSCPVRPLPGGLLLGSVALLACEPGLGALITICLAAPSGRNLLGR